MKPECHRVVEQLAALSANDLSPTEAEAVRRHLEACPPCKGHWVLFERTLLTLNSASQPKLTAEQSRQMWLVCLEHTKAAQAGNKPWAALHNGSDDDSSEAHSLWESLVKTFSWLTATPRTGWAVAGGAAAILGLTYFLAPHPQGAEPAPQVAFAPLPQADLIQFRDFGRSGLFQAPPANASQLVDYHTAMSFEPYSDHVAPSLIAYSASAPARFEVPNNLRPAQ
jgi:hypothetical protein